MTIFFFKNVKIVNCPENEIYIFFFRINPVTGHIAPPKRSPFEGMSEEQKEYEANKLANMIHQLHELGAMKPGKIGPDGKPIAVEHVLELIEGEQFRPGQRNEDSDSDWICIL